MANSKKLFIITGDYSGDKHALFTVNELKRQNPDLIIEGIGGINLQKAGIKLFCNQDKMNGMGISFSSVISSETKKIPPFEGKFFANLRIMRRIVLRKSRKNAKQGEKVIRPSSFCSPCACARIR